jgi:hypothetical protein
MTTTQHIVLRVRGPADRGRRHTAPSSQRPRRTRPLRALALAILLAATLPSSVQAAGRGPSARAARTLGASDVAHLHYVRSSGSYLFEEGSATGGMPGSMKVDLNVGATFSGSFTIYTQNGSIKGHGSATPHGSGRYESFSGSLTVTGGTGRYAHAHGTAGLYGTFDRKTYALVIQTTGKLSY